MLMLEPSTLVQRYKLIKCLRGTRGNSPRSCFKTSLAILAFAEKKKKRCGGSPADGSSLEQGLLTRCHYNPGDSTPVFLFRLKKKLLFYLCETQNRSPRRNVETQLRFETVDFFSPHFRGACCWLSRGRGFKKKFFFFRGLGGRHI